MELYQLRSFVAVADEGHLTRAAERLFTSQPAVSAHIKALEEELQLTLFQRTAKGMQLTREGKLLRAKAERALASVSDLLFQARLLKRELVGEVKLAVQTDPAFLRLPAIHAELAAKNPGLELHFLQGMSPSILYDIKHGLLDGGFYFGDNPYREVRSVLLCRARLCVVGPAAWAERIARADWHEIAEMSWIFATPDCPFRQVMETLFNQHGARPRESAVANDESTLLALVRAGVGLTLMREEEATAGVHEGTLSVWPRVAAPIGLSFAYLGRRQQDPLIQALIGVVSRTWDLTDELALRIAPKPAAAATAS